MNAHKPRLAAVGDWRYSRRVRDAARDQAFGITGGSLLLALGLAESEVPGDRVRPAGDSAGIVMPADLEAVLVAPELAEL